SQGAGSAAIAARLNRKGAAEIFGDRQAIVARGPALGSAVAVDGGYRLTGRWPFASGCRHATWLSRIAALAQPAGRQRRGEDGTLEVRSFFFPAGHAEILDVWDVNGLRGTGSDTFAVTDVFVPTRHTLSPADPRWATGPLFAFPANSIYATGFAS